MASSYSLIANHVENLHKTATESGHSPVHQYAYLAGTLTIHVVTLVDYVAVHCGEEAKQHVLDLMGISTEKEKEDL